VIVRVPASSANLGPGFDTLGLALGLYLELRFDSAPDGTTGSAVPGGGPTTEEEHPGVRAFRQLGGTGPVCIRSRIPIGRGLGFSGSARVAGLVAALAQRGGAGFHPLDEAEQLLHVATALEGHADNIAPSIFGGVVASAGGHAVRIPLPFEPAVVVWVPAGTTSTDQSRAALSHSVAFADAVFNVGRTALLVAALAAGNVHALRTATEDRLHQDQRFARSPGSRAALEAALEAGAWCGWLSGSGPTIATLCAPEEAEALAAALPGDGRSTVLAMDLEGAVIAADPDPPTS
jgi:homoserine kinase